MSVSRSGYYKWKYRQENPTEKMISKKKYIKNIHHMDIDGLMLMQDYIMEQCGLIIMFIYAVNMKEYVQKENIINGKKLKKNIKNLIIWYGTDGNT